MYLQAVRRHLAAVDRPPGYGAKSTALPSSHHGNGQVPTSSHPSLIHLRERMFFSYDPWIKHNAEDAPYNLVYCRIWTTKYLAEGLLFF